MFGFNSFISDSTSNRTELLSDKLLRVALPKVSDFFNNNLYIISKYKKRNKNYLKLIESTRLFKNLLKLFFLNHKIVFI